MNFYINQRVICVNDYPYNTSTGFHPLKKYKIYTIKGLKLDCCGLLVVDVGINTSNIIGRKYIRQECGHIETSDGIWWFYDNNFAPIEEIPESHEEAVKELLTEKLVLS